MSGENSRFDRRTFLGAAALSAAVASSDAAPAPKVNRVIATEESFGIPEIAGATQALMSSPKRTEEPGLVALAAGFGPQQSRQWQGEALDLGAGRIAAMDAAGVDTQILLLGAPGVQIFDAVQGSELAALANDRIATLQNREPYRFAALTSIAPQDPGRAALEIERGVRGLGLKGVLINSHTRGEYLDAPKFRPIFEAAQALDTPIYIHPRDPSPEMLAPYQAHSLVGPIWGFAAETGLHALRLIMAGVFDDFPRLRIVLGHLGEGLPFFIDRVDIRYARDGSPGRRVLKRKPSDYLRSNFELTTSGMNYAPSVRQAIEVMGVERIMFAADWPYEDAVAATRQFNGVKLTDEERRLILHANAERCFRLQPA